MATTATPYRNGTSKPNPRAAAIAKAAAAGAKPVDMNTETAASLADVIDCGRAVFDTVRQELAQLRKDIMSMLPGLVETVVSKSIDARLAQLRVEIADKDYASLAKSLEKFQVPAVHVSIPAEAFELKTDVSLFIPPESINLDVDLAMPDGAIQANFPNLQIPREAIQATPAPVKTVKSIIYSPTTGRPEKIVEEAVE